MLDSTEDFDSIYFYCLHCNEEYELPENIEECPICGKKELEVI